ncbi:MAG: SGNH/GDSL hydrolase family protein [Alphaproteobacteria bacterium]|nr:SGNH/GDSL hydrolase family protein [Alphaproteobacteria bacterium]
MPTLLLALATLSATATAAEVVVFGDSWAEGGGDELEDALHAAGYRYDVANYGVGGTTAESWNATAPDALSLAVAANPDARWVWLSILGNDTFGHHAARNGNAAAADNERELRAMLDRLHRDAPDVQVVSFAYDFVNFEQSVDCLITASLYFPAMVDAGTLSTLNVNQTFDRDIAQVQARVAADHPRYAAYTQWGTLQRDAGAASVDWSLPSPASRMSDCIHPTSHGYRVLHDGLVHLYWDVAEPTAQLSGAPTGPVCAGTTVSLGDRSLGAEARLWWVDGDEVGSDVDLDVLVPRGSLPVRLRTYAGAWHDDVDLTLEGVDPPAATASGGGSVCVGDGLTLHAGGADTVAWSPTDGLDDPAAADPFATPSATTTYTATVSSAPGCDATADVTVTVLPRPDARLDGPDAAVPDTDVPFDVAGDADHVVWEAPGASVTADGTHATLSFPEPGRYDVTAHVTGANGCAVDVVRTVQVIADVAQDTDAGGDGAASCGCATPRGATGRGLVAWGLLLGLAARRRQRPT